MKRKLITAVIALLVGMTAAAQISVGLQRPMNTDGTYAAYTSTAAYAKSQDGVSVTFWESEQIHATQTTSNTTTLYTKGVSVQSDFAWGVTCSGPQAKKHPADGKFPEGYAFGFDMTVPNGKKLTINDITIDLMVSAFPTWRIRILKENGEELYNSNPMEEYMGFRTPTNYGNYGYVTSEELVLVYPGQSGEFALAAPATAISKGFQLLPENFTLQAGKYRVLLDFDYDNTSGQPKALSFDSYLVGGTLSDDASTAPSGYVPTIYGVVINASNWSTSNPKYGVYSFMPSESLIFPTEEYLDQLALANCGGVWENKKLHIMRSISNSSGNYFNNYRCWNTDTWELVANKDLSSNEMHKLAADLTWDPVDQRVYGLFFTQNGEAYEFGWIDFTTNSPEKHSIRQLPITMVAIAANKQGEIYGIGVNGFLYKFNKETGVATVVGNTTVPVTEYRQSATFDFRTGKLYWAAMLSETESALFEVDTETGAATRIATFANSEEITALYIPFGIANDDAPAQAESLKITAENGTRQPKVTFRIPTETYSGGTLSGPVYWELYVNGEMIRSGSGTPGSERAATIWVYEGMNTFTVLLRNDAGESPKAALTTYIGEDTPVAPENLQLTVDNANYKATLSWNAPSRGVHNGYLNPDNISYTIKRYPGEVVLQTNYKQTEIIDELPHTAGQTQYYYTVQTFHGEKGSELSTTPKVNVGEAMPIPWSEDFSDKTKFSQFTVIDVDNDNWTWVHSTDNGGCAVAKNNDLYNENDQDDWLITPPLAMTADRLYTLEFEASSNWLWDRAKEEYLEVGFGDNPNAQNYEMVVERRVIQPETEGIPVKISVQLRPQTDGHYYVGFHAVSPLRNANNLYLHNITVKEASLLSSPDSVTNLRVEAAARGALRATVKFNAPTKDLAGNNLTTLTQIKVIRDGQTQETIATFNAPTPGQELSYEDTKAVNGFNSYIVLPMSGDNEGQARRVTGYVGIDIPTKPLNIVARLDGNTIKVTWDVPSEVGVNGGYVDVDDVFYQVFDKNGNIMSGALELYDREYTVTSVTMTGPQATHQYIVLPISELGEGDPGVSNVVLTGDPYELPIEESFANGGAKYLWWMTQDNSYYMFKTTTQYSSDGDNGSLYFLGSSYLNNISASFGSGKINIKSASNPTWSFAYYPYVGHDVVAKVQVQTSDFVDHDVMTIDFKTMTGANDWRKAVIDLTPFKNSDWVVLKMTATISGASQFTVDAIKVEDASINDLSGAIYVPKSMRIGKAKDVKVTVKNNGVNDVSDYSVRLFADDVEVATKTGNAVSGLDSTIVAFSYAPAVTSNVGIGFRAEIDYADDIKPANNTTNEGWTEVLQPTLPPVENFQGSEDAGNVTLTWSAPDLDAAKEVTEDFEDYSSWLTEGFGEWKTIDQDNGRTYNLEGTTFYNQTMQMGFMLYNHDETVGKKYSAMMPHSGQQYAASFDAIANYSPIGKTEDWLISPELSGEAQTISFFARSVAEAYLEKMEVAYTTGDAMTRSGYTSVKTVDGVPNGWTEYSVDLPAGAKHFAIKNISTDMMALIVDDVTYAPVPLVLTGYDIYVDGEKVGHVGPDTFEFNTIGDTSHSYQIVAVYTTGESALSAVFGTNGIGNVLTTIDLNAEDMTAYTLDGVKVAQGVGVYNQLKRGVYILKFNATGKTMRVVKR